MNRKPIFRVPPFVISASRKRFDTDLEITDKELDFIVNKIRKHKLKSKSFLHSNPNPMENYIDKKMEAEAELHPQEYNLTNEEKANG